MQEEIDGMVQNIWVCNLEVMGKDVQGITLGHHLVTSCLH